MSIITKFHIYWLQGGLWPGKDYKDLIDKVAGRGDEMPGTITYIFVLFVFIAMALFPLALYFKIDLGIEGYEKYLALFFAIIFALRTISMSIPVIGNRATKIFLEYNKKYYAPLCLSLSISYFFSENSPHKSCACISTSENFHCLSGSLILLSNLLFCSSFETEK